MLSRHSARASVPHARNLLRPLASCSAGSQQASGVSRWAVLSRPNRGTPHYRLISTFLNSSARKESLQNATVLQWTSGSRLSTAAAAPSESPQPSDLNAINALIEKINQNEDEMAQMIEGLEFLDDLEVSEELADPLGSEEYTPEAWVLMVRQQFGDRIPDGVLNEEELQIFTRLYGEPVIQEPVSESIGEEAEKDSDRLFRENGQGGWDEIEYEQNENQKDDTTVVYDMDIGPEETETIAMRRTREVAEQLGGEIMLEQFENEAVPDAAPRAHPLTQEGKFQTNPSTINLPKKTVTGPISVILSEFSNRHIAETAHRLFGGPGLPHSTTTPPPRAQLPQLPIPLHASQHHMGEMEANAYIAALYPGIYASVLSVLVEVRKRMGTDWIRNLISQDGGPNVLDASGGGAGILAWRDVIRAEWELMVPDHPEGVPIPFGRSTVLTGSETLRLRASAMLENTSFLPRLPDYVHVREKPTLEDSRAAPKRKQYDVIIAPHTLLGYDEEYQRKDHVENLWALLNPNGGVLVLLEKGRQKGFEAIAGAREMLLKRHIASPGSAEYESFLESSEDGRTVAKEPGMIIAPCTNHSTCPMHNPAGPTKGRKDYCHFEQRYIRPPFLQRIMGAKDRNHEDIKFSYLAVQRGVDMRQQKGIRQDAEMTDAAFEGYEHLEEPELSSVNPLSLPRAVYAPLKRRGHVIFDLCTPGGQIERWTVPRSFSRQAYRDARKSNWGDLWALGAKTRISRKLNLGDKHGEGKKERLARRAAAKAEAEEEGAYDELDPEEDEVDGYNEGEGLDRSDALQIPKRKKGQNIPSWKKNADKKKLRQAQKKRDAAEDAL
ncbi:hypothetical protein N7462_002481 [Penicillium macrosclerotiorum]|uniref:uncharacterized protein n=1 Tax=Penicillium macrosclerotiorum TaxID=303699 RepID=UPI0025471926|nr:uncharacterized protein N7462_002481 [Penicillium macrosclerotiorum]KAJ5693058.1 hypothetical protein N7462_002481 [Penicillium macrosclerotiorum]